MNSLLRLPAPAKVNLFLHINGRREDGYHNIQTVFQFLEISDYLSFEPSYTLELTPQIDGVNPEDNLIIKAAKILQNHTGTNYGAKIILEKNLPMGGGIGGGSSDAATTLVGLNKLWKLNLPSQTLKFLGKQLGADVPIFIHGQSAWAEGIGEELTNINPPEKWYVLLIPQCHVATGTIFSHPQLTRHTKMLKIAAFLEQGLQDGFHNDCEPLVRQLHNEVDEAIELLGQYGEARMTGTGACVFTRCDTEDEAQQICAKMPKHLQALVTKGVNQSPLYTVLDSVD